MVVDSFRNIMVKQFLCGTRPLFINFERISTDINHILLALSHPQMKKYPLKTSYILNFLKQVMTEMEKNENECCDDLYTEYVKLIQNYSNEGPFYKHFIINNNINEFEDIVITIKESTNIVSEGTTGLCIWQAGVALSCWCLLNKDKFENKFILELGCGTGLSGISVCTICKPLDYWFTDCHTSVMDNLKHNIQINESNNPFNCKYNTLELSWDNIKDSKIFEKKTPDLVLAADIVFDPTMFDSLCSSLEYFAMNNSEILLFCTIRNTETYNKFLETLGKHNLSYSLNVLPNNFSILLTQDCPIHIVNVKKTSNCTIHYNQL